MICGVKIMKITEYWSTNSGLAGKSDAVTAKDTIVGANSQFTGNIMFTQTLKISGTVKGNIESNDDSDAQVTVESNGVVEGDVTAPIVILKGEVNGNVHSSAKIIIDASSNEKRLKEEKRDLIDTKNEMKVLIEYVNMLH